MQWKTGTPGFHYNYHTTSERSTSFPRQFSNSPVPKGGTIPVDTTCGHSLSMKKRVQWYQEQSRASHHLPQKQAQRAGFTKPSPWEHGGGCCRPAHHSCAAVTQPVQNTLSPSGIKLQLGNREKLLKTFQELLAHRSFSQTFLVYIKMFFSLSQTCELLKTPVICV